MRASLPPRSRSWQTNLCLQAGHLVPNLWTFQGKQPSSEAKPRLSFPKVMRGPLGRGAELASQLLLPQPGAERGGACGAGRGLRAPAHSSRAAPRPEHSVLTDPSAASSARQVKRRRVGQGGNRAGNPRVYKEEKKKKKRPLSGSTVVPAATSWPGEEQEAGGGGRRGGGRKTPQLAPLGLRAPASPQQTVLQVPSTQGRHASWKLLCL